MRFALKLRNYINEPILYLAVNNNTIVLLSEINIYVLTQSESIKKLYKAVNPTTKLNVPIVSKPFYQYVMANADIFDGAINNHRDYDFDYFALIILQKSYLLKINKKVVERPQHMLMRVAIATWIKDEIRQLLTSYKLMSLHYYIHSSQTLKTAGTVKQHLQESFTFTVEDSTEGVFKSLNHSATLSKCSGSMGIGLQDVRPNGSLIANHKGVSNGVVPMLKLFDNTYSYVDQCQRGTMTFYIELWHKDIFDILNLRNTRPAPISNKFYYGIIVPKLFFHRLSYNEVWSLMCPDSCPGLTNALGAEFTTLYEQYELIHQFSSQVSCEGLWRAVCRSLIESGGPVILFKESCNQKSNHQHLGTIKTSNQYGDMLHYSSHKDLASHQSASISLKKFISQKTKKVDYIRLQTVTKHITKELNKLIDNGYYSLPELRRSNICNRPIAIGVQGFADLLMELRLPFTSNQALNTNAQIFENIYFAALATSCDLAIKSGQYITYNGSPAKENMLQFDMWPSHQSSLPNWSDLRQKVQLTGLRNSLLISVPPATITAQLLGNYEANEPYPAMLYKRKLYSEEFLVMNKYLQNELIRLRLWNDQMKSELIERGGTIEYMRGIPAGIKTMYRCAWEISQEKLVTFARQRAPFIDQSQAITFYLYVSPVLNQINDLIHLAYKLGLKTGVSRVLIKSDGLFVLETEDREVVDALNEPSRRKKSVNLSDLTSTDIYFV